jgi:hypothetical protein
MPYLVDFQNPTSVQCIEFSENIHTVVPGEFSLLKLQIADAIGLPKERFLTFPQKLLLVEGPSDKIFFEQVNRILHDQDSEAKLGADIEIWNYGGIEELSHLCKILDSWDFRNFVLIYDNDSTQFERHPKKNPSNMPEIRKFPSQIFKLSHPEVNEDVAIEDFIPSNIFKNSLEKYLAQFYENVTTTQKIMEQFAVNNINQSQIISKLNKEEKLSKTKFMQYVFTEIDTEFEITDAIIELFKIIQAKFNLVK